jgi:hypothetical protein
VGHFGTFWVMGEQAEEEKGRRGEEETRGHGDKETGAGRGRGMRSGESEAAAS